MSEQCEHKWEVASIDKAAFSLKIKYVDFVCQKCMSMKTEKVKIIQSEVKKE